MQELCAPIGRVIVAEDRAFVRRQAQLELEPGRSRYRLSGVSPVIVDKSLAVFLDGQAQHISTQVVRSKATVQSEVTLADPPAAAAENGQADLLESEMRAADALYHELLLVIAEQAAWGHAEPQQWEDQLQEILHWKDELEQRQLAQLPAPPPAQAYTFPELSEPPRLAEVILDLDSPAGGPLRLTLEYCVPLAAWRPYHQAEFLGDRVHFSAQGCIWQNTGEDWNEVELVLSTERQSLGVLPPPVPQDYLNTRKRSAEIVLQEREVNMEELLETSPEREIPGIDDGGQVFSAPVAGRCSVKSDGYAVRVPLFDFSCPTAMENLLIAEVNPQVVQLTRLSNGAAWPILAGPVDLLREAGWVGRARLGLVSPGQGFQLGWGPQTSLRATRSEEQGKSEKDDLLGGWMRRRTQTTVILSNLSARTQNLEVIERIPVSEIKQVEISADLKSVQPPTRPDENGFLRWTLELGPRSKTVIEAAYWTRKRKEVITA